MGDQSDREGWARFRRQMAEKGVSFDVILDDGAAVNPNLNSAAAGLPAAPYSMRGLPYCRLGAL